MFLLDIHQAAALIPPFQDPLLPPVKCVLLDKIRFRQNEYDLFAMLEILNIGSERVRKVERGTSSVGEE